MLDRGEDEDWFASHFIVLFASCGRTTELPYRIIAIPAISSPATQKFRSFITRISTR
jgi:hypothetical protein